MLGERRTIFMMAVQIKLLLPDKLSITWDDGHAGSISLISLRDHCPCAGCQGETILLKTYMPQTKPKLAGMYTLTGVQQVGHYAVQMSWGDGHATGIYPWQILRDLCECPDCLSEKRNE